VTGGGVTDVADVVGEEGEGSGDGVTDASLSGSRSRATMSAELEQAATVSMTPQIPPVSRLIADSRGPPSVEVVALQERLNAVLPRGVTVPVRSAVA